MVRSPSIGKFGASLRALLSSITHCYSSIKYIFVIIILLMPTVITAASPPEPSIWI